MRTKRSEQTLMNYDPASGLLTLTTDQGEVRQFTITREHYAAMVAAMRAEGWPLTDAAVPSADGQLAVYPGPCHRPFVARRSKRGKVTVKCFCCRNGHRRCGYGVCQGRTWRGTAYCFHHQPLPAEGWLEAVLKCR